MAKARRNINKKFPRKKMIEEEVEEAKTNSLFKEGLAILLCFFAVFVLLSLISYFSNLTDAIRISDPANAKPVANLMGSIGFHLSHHLVDRLGYCSFSFVACVVLIAGLILRQGAPQNLLSPYKVTIIAFFCLMLTLSISSLCSILFGYDGGGYFGTVIAVTLDNYVNKAGTILVSIAAIVLSLGVLVNIRLYHYFTGIKLIWSGAKSAAKDTGVILNVGAKVGNNAVRKATKVLTKERFSWTSGPADQIEDDEEFVLGDDEEEFTIGNTSRKKKLRKARRTTNVRRAREEVIDDEDEYEEDEDVEEDEDDEDFFEDEYDEDDDLEFSDEDEEDFDDEDEEEEDEPVAYVPLISREKAKIEDRKQKLVTRNKTVNYSEYQLPGREFLVGMEGVSVDGPEDDELLENSKRLEVSLRNFKLGGRVVEVHPGPIVTQYQFEPAAGIKVQRIINLADDLALALKVESVRVYAPVPGKGTVGIEVPNQEREVVRLRDIVESDDFLVKPFPLPLALGKDTYGQAFVADLSKMPHLLIAGATGTGKSVCINSLLMSLLYKNSPSDLRLILIDPKMLELSTYESIPHLLSPVVTNPKRARGVLYWAVEEMERRYELMKEFGVRDMAMFNRMIGEGEGRNKNDTKKKKNELINLEEKDVLTTTAAKAMIDRNSAPEDTTKVVSGFEPLPRIVIVVDELADLMLTVGKEIEELLTRLAQKARAAGIHLILATQRPSVNVITGLIKANFPARISFKVASKIDARTVMDTSGAERLLGQGDMLFMSPSVGKVKRLHSPFVSDQEVHDVVGWIRTQGEPDYDVQIEKTLKTLEEQENKAGFSESSGGISEYDPLYDEAVNLVLQKGQASTSMVQRVFRIGYNRAARILEVMEKEGVVGPADGSKPRQILIDSLESRI